MDTQWKLEPGLKLQRMNKRHFKIFLSKCFILFILDKAICNSSGKGFIRNVLLISVAAEIIYVF